MPSKSPCKPSQSSGLLLHGFPVTPHPFANIIFCYFKHLPTCPGRTAGRLLLGSLELIPRQELSSLPRSPGAQSCLSYLWAGGGGGSSSCPGHPGSCKLAVSAGPQATQSQARAGAAWQEIGKSTRLNSSHTLASRMPSSA